MSRKGREKSGTGIYHVMLRGINRQDIFEDAEDYMSFTKILAAVQDRLEDDLITKTTTCHNTRVFLYAFPIHPSESRQGRTGQIGPGLSI